MARTLNGINIINFFSIMTNNITVKKGSHSDLVVNQILVRPLWRLKYDIGKWREAIKLSDLDRRQMLYRLYDDMLLDGVLSRSIEKRGEAITNSELVFADKNGKAVDEITKIIDTAQFEDMLYEIYLTKAWGTTALEFDFSNGFNFFSIPRRNIRPKTKEIALDENDEFGIPVANDENIIFFGKDNDMGFLMKASQYVIYKRGGFGDWAQYVELFGMPQRIGKYNTTDTASRDALIQALKQAGSAPYVVVPKDTDLETVLNKGQGNSTLYDDFRKACNEELTITILGNTLTTTQGSVGSQALGTVHEDVEEAVHKSDRRFVQRMLNSKILPLLQKRGFPVAGGKFQFPQEEEELEVSDYVELSTIMPVPVSFLQDRFNIPAPKGDEAIAGARVPAPGPDAASGPTEPEPANPNPDDPIDPVKPSDPVKKKPDVPVKNNDDHNFLIRLWDFFGRPRKNGAPLDF
jgi:hypothetical protein